MGMSYPIVSIRQWQDSIVDGGGKALYTRQDWTLAGGRIERSQYMWSSFG
jgi:hypothetical protein